MTKFLIIRHGQSEANLLDLFAGNFDAPLTELGILQAQRTAEYIKENYNHNLSVESIANMLGIERSYLSRLFKTYKNKSTQNYIIDYRIGRAKKMFEEEDLNVSQVCAAVGYTNVYCFSRIFKSRVGMSPKEYREKCKRENA